MPNDESVRSRSAIESVMLSRLERIYGTERAPFVLARLLALVPPGDVLSVTGLSLSERDVVLIAYADHVQSPGEAPLQTLRRLLKQQVAPAINTVHLLPFYPYSSDDGFSVIDYEQVDPALGNWSDVRALGQDFRLMFDAVFNHISAQSRWFQGFLRGEAPYTDYFITVDPTADLSLVTRPRTLPLLTPVETPSGVQHVWTTFSDDQIDLNYANPDVLVEMIRILLFYVEQGADLIRLDAIAFLWKQPGTTSIHLEQTHLIIQLMRDLLDLVAPHVVLITETNVPHEENLSYFGDGTNEAQLVYQFSLPPLVLHTLHTGDARKLSTWAAGIQRVSDRTTYFNFTASHDGIGMRPATGILSDEEIQSLVQLAVRHGGYVSLKTNPDGTQSPYELNITYFDAITDPHLAADDPQTAVARFLVSQAIMLAFVGVPGIYLPSLFGSRNDRAGVEQTGRYRSINRQKFTIEALQSEIADPHSITALVFAAYRDLIIVRTAEPAFHPLGSQSVLNLGPGVFALERISPDGQDRLVAVHNVTGQPVDVVLPAYDVTAWYDLVQKQPVTTTGAPYTLAPYQILWLKQLTDLKD